MTTRRRQEKERVRGTERPAATPGRPTGGVPKASSSSSDAALSVAGPGESAPPETAGRAMPAVASDAAGPGDERNEEGAAARAIDSGQPKMSHRDLMAVAQCLPGTFRPYPAPAAMAGGPQGAVLIHPAAAAIAVNSGGRQIADPFQARRGGDVVAMAIQHRIAAPVRRRGGDHMSGPGQCRQPVHRQRTGPVEGKQRNAERGPGRARALGATGAGYRPAFRQ